LLAVPQQFNGHSIERAYVTDSKNFFLVRRASDKLLQNYKIGNMSNLWVGLFLSLFKGLG